MLYLFRYAMSPPLFHYRQHASPCHVADAFAIRFDCHIRHLLKRADAPRYAVMRHIAFDITRRRLRRQVALYAIARARYTLRSRLMVTPCRAPCYATLLMPRYDAPLFAYCRGDAVAR